MKDNAGQAVWAAGCMVAMGLVVSGCTVRQQQAKDSERVMPVQVQQVLSGQVKAALDATGSLDAWRAVEELQAKCIVTVFELGGSYYLTEQRQQVQPWAGTIRVYADEPEGRFVWELVDSGFVMQAGPREAKAEQVPLCDRRVAAVVLDLMAAPVRILGRDGSGSIQVGGTTKINGRWYSPLQTPSEEGAKRVFYQNPDNSVLELVSREDKGGGGIILGLGYNWRIVRPGGVMVPSRVEILRSGGAGLRYERIAEIDYHEISASLAQVGLNKTGQP